MKEEIQRAYIEFQIIEQQLKQSQQQILLLQQQTEELNILIDNLENLKKLKPNTSSYSHLGPGIAVKTKIEEPDHVLISVGSKTMVKKTIPEAQKSIKKQLDDVQEFTKTLQKEMENLASHAQTLHQRIQEAQQESQ